MKFSPEEPSGRHLESFFASLIDSPAHDFNLALSRLLETAVQFSLQDTAGIPAKSLGTWYGASVVAILGALLDTQTKGFRYGSKKEGHPQAFILNEIRTKTGGKELIVTLKQHLPQGRNGWATFVAKHPKMRFS